MSDSPYIVTVTTENFAQLVLEQSYQVPVLADFWADWCQPCQMLMPVLQQMAEQAEGKFILAKINADEQQRLAMEYGVRSLPTLKIFRNGEAVDELMGAQPEPEIWRVLEPHMAHESDDARDQAMALSAAGDHANAEAALRAMIEHDPTRHELKQNLAQVLIAAERYQEAKDLLLSLPADIQSQDGTRQALARLDFIQQVEGAPEPTALEAAVAENKLNFKAHQQLSAYKVLMEDYAGAMDHLLFIMRKDRSFEDDAGQKGLLKVFELLGNDPLVNQYRRKMSSLLF